MCNHAREYFINFEGDVYFRISSLTLYFCMSVFSIIIIIGIMPAMWLYIRIKQYDDQYVKECAFK